MMMRHRPSNQSSLGSLRCGDACLDSPVNSREARKRDVAVGRAFGRAQTGEGAAPAVILPPNAEGTGSAQYALHLYAYLLYTMLLAEPFVNYCYMPMTPMPPRAPNFKGAFDHLQTLRHS